MSDIDLQSILQALQDRELSLADAHQQINAELQAPHTATLTEARLDLERARRCGFPEVIFAEGKSTETVVELFARLRAENQPALATRVSEEQAHWLLDSFPDATFNRLARTVQLRDNEEQRGRVVVITAGTSDRPVAEETLETLKWMGCGCELIVDVGVAGPRRLLAELPNIADVDAVVVVAGMEGALPSVVGGWVDCPVIAVPTSVGYGAAFGGLAALLGMLNSCAANVTVVNIDAGFKAGYIAGLIALRQPQEPA